MTDRIIDALVYLGQKLQSPEDHIEIRASIEKSIDNNPWFDKPSIDYALRAISQWLTMPILQDFVSGYKIKSNPKRIGVISAGNIPAVGFHDMLTVLLSNNIYVGKTSSKDEDLLPMMGRILIEYDEALEERICFAEERLPEVDAIIATGSDNANMYFQYYFSKYPNIIRHSRTSISVIGENPVDYPALVSDILTHKGLGCRNVTKLYLPKDYDFKPLIDALQTHAYLLDHNKYRNNYDYHKAIYLMNSIPFYDATTALLLENETIHSPVSVIHYTHYDSLDQVRDIIHSHQDQLQCVVSSEDIEGSMSFGKSQSPLITDFADNIDTMKFLTEL